MLPIQITMKDVESSPAIKSQIEDRVDKLLHYYERISACRVVIDVPQKHKHQGKLFNVRIDLTVPGKELAVTRKQNEDIYVAIRDAFDALEKQLDEYARKRQGRIKNHEMMAKGFVKKIFVEEGYGFIEGTDGVEYYFSDLNIGYPSFKQLTIGDQVGFLPQTMSNGHHAHRIVKVRENI